uniref:NADH-ubiquinone oxidoreductase chain 3 n=1 Tax=Homotoma ficus TaxID=2218120 RepID=A0A344A2F0_9HEMI|nr:NADH dehydrogenase subunit 3 [Homotoma ficus]AWU48941.1 NADH dehydrogenase subunit 3 [Homotoma ficus]
MFLMFNFMMILSLLMMMIMNVIPIINSHKMSDREKMSPFECGFDPMAKSRIPFSIQFFSISMMFLIFDIEIVMIMPLPMTSNMTNYNTWMYLNIFLMIMLILGVILEWKEGSMNWK